MTKLTIVLCYINIQFTGWQLFLNAIGAVVLWNVTNLYLRKLVIRGYRLVVIAIVVNSSLCTGYYSIRRLLCDFRFWAKENWCSSPLITN